MKMGIEGFVCFARSCIVQGCVVMMMLMRSETEMWRRGRG
jgi:hypothetical protein